MAVHVLAIPGLGCDVANGDWVVKRGGLGDGNSRL